MLAAFAVGEAGPTTVALTAATADASSCKGDSGGPVFQTVGGQPSLYAINNTSWQRGCLGSTETRDGATATRLDDIKGWIEQNTRELPPSDFDVDGKADLLIIDKATGDQLWWTPNTSTVGNPSRGMALGLGKEWKSVSEQRLADYDSDGRPDIVGWHADQLLVWRNTSTGGTPTYAPVRLARDRLERYQENPARRRRPRRQARHPLVRSQWRPAVVHPEHEHRLLPVPRPEAPSCPTVSGRSRTRRWPTGTATERSMCWAGPPTRCSSAEHEHGRQPSFAPYVVIGDRFDTLPRTLLGDFNADGKVDIAGWNVNTDQLWFHPNRAPSESRPRGPASC